jgi:L-fuconolactonase
LRIDAHQHFWTLARGDYGWLTPELDSLYRDFDPDDLRPHLAGEQIDQTVLVQAAPTPAETHHLLELARRTDFVAAVVGWVDLEAPDAAETLAELAREPLLRGVRPIIQDLPDPEWMLRASLEPGLGALAELELRFDALVQPRHLAPLLRFVERYPELRIVIDHGAKPDIAAGAFDDWAEPLAAVARAGDVHCKLSGLITEAAPDWKPADLAPYVDHLLDVFGPGRLLWGSDWPVVDLAGGHAAWCDATRVLLSGLGDDDRTQILGRTAARFYGIQEASE